MKLVLILHCFNDEHLLVKVHTPTHPTPLGFTMTFMEDA